MKLSRSDIEKWYSRANESRALDALLARDFAEGVVEELLYPASVCEVDGDVLALAKLETTAALAVLGANRGRFVGHRPAGDLIVCPLTPGNAGRLRTLLPFTAPTPLGDRRVTLGLGDRLGIASPGHLRVIQRIRRTGREEIQNSTAPVLAQQSVRELNLTRRTYREVLDAATWAVFQEGYRGGWGADGDHLKTPAWVKRSLRLGYTMITADVSDAIRNEFVQMEETEMLAAYERRVGGTARRDYERRYLSFALKIEGCGEIRFSRAELARIVLVYGKAADYAATLYRAGASIRKSFDFELSIDETVTPTLPQAHVFMAEEMKRREIPVTSMAPRFVGEFQKGIDYIGDREEFESSFRIHAAVARAYGYRISVHSGSDKFSVFPAVGAETGYRFHLKTAGTNWLQALLVIAETRPAFFMILYRKALASFPRARRYYHITPDLTRLPAPEQLKAETLPGLFSDADVRQVLHVTYGEILRDPKLKREIYRVLQDNIDDYWRSLETHIGRHAECLGLVSQ